MGMEDKYRVRIEEGLLGPAPHERLAAIAIELSSDGLGQDEILQIFESFRAELRLADRKTDEDVLMDVMDRICGWCSPHVRLFPAG